MAFLIPDLQAICFVHSFFPVSLRSNCNELENVEFDRSDLGLRSRSSYSSSSVCKEGYTRALHRDLRVLAILILLLEWWLENKKDLVRSFNSQQQRKKKRYFSSVRDQLLLYNYERRRKLSNNSCHEIIY